MKSILSLVFGLICATCAHGITIETVSIGDVGNPNDPATGNLYGGVNYAYSIGTYEVTIGQYTAFLNAVAATDTYGLYTLSMPQDLTSAGITRAGTSGSYSYSSIGSVNHPVAHVSWGDAARFANWLHNGQPTGVEGPGTTETGAYTLNGATSEAALMAITRNAGAMWFIPTENEWYKAAYYQPTAQGGDFDSYWAYPIKSNSVPYSDQPLGATPDDTRVGNFFNDDGSANGHDDGYAVTGSTSYNSSQNYLTDVGAYTSSPSFYRTFDQGGNVFEWNEALSISGRGMRGGGWVYSYADLQASSRLFVNPRTGENQQFGFRMASMAVPEPSSILLAVAAFSILPSRRRRSVPHDRV